MAVSENEMKLCNGKFFSVDELNNTKDQRNG